jgi:hypothetical protein
VATYTYGRPPTVLTKPFSDEFGVPYDDPAAVKLSVQSVGERKRISKKPVYKLE